MQPTRGSFSVLSTYFSFLYLCLFLFYFSLFSISLYFLFLWYLSIPRFLLCLFYFWLIWFLYFNVYSNLYLLLDTFCILFNFSFSACNKEPHWALGRTEADQEFNLTRKEEIAQSNPYLRLSQTGTGSDYGEEEKKR